MNQMLPEKRRYTLNTMLGDIEDRVRRVEELSDCGSLLDQFRSIDCKARARELRRLADTLDDIAHAQKRNAA